MKRPGLRLRCGAIAAVACVLSGIASAGSAGVAYASVTVKVRCSSGARGGGAAGLIAAIRHANAHGGGTINLAFGCTYRLGPNADNGHNGLPVVKTSITINGSRSTVARSQAPGTVDFRIFEVDGPGRLTLNSLAITGGRASDGGGILNAGGGVLTLNNCRLHDNTVTLSGAGAKTSGGGISSEEGVVVTLNNTRVDHNAATGTAGALAVGGGLYENDGGRLRLNNSRVDHNAATATQVAQGGGIGVDFMGPPRAVALSGSQVDHNRVTATESAADVVAKGGGVGTNGTKLTLFNSRVISNAAHAPGGTASGGGVFSLTAKAVASQPAPDPHGLLGIKGSEVTGNAASGDSAGGGGISNQVGTAEISRSHVTANTVSATGIAGGRGGGIENFHIPIKGAPIPSLTMTFTRLSHNTVTGSMKPARGSGLFNSGSATLKSASVTRNQAAGSPAQGGGLFNDEGGSIVLAFSQVSHNTPDNCFPRSTIARCVS